MKNKRMQDFNLMLFVLRRIANGYQSASQIMRNSEKQYGLDFEETLGYAYENIQQEAKIAIKGVREWKNNRGPRIKIDK